MLKGTAMGQDDLSLGASAACLKCGAARHSDFVGEPCVACGGEIAPAGRNGPVAGERAKRDSVNHPLHYNEHPSGVECIDIVEHMPFNIGNAVKYLWRCGLKNDAIEELEKAQWYIKREIELRRSRAAKGRA
jgi:hypothetical protein